MIRMLAFLVLTLPGFAAQERVTAKITDFQVRLESTQSGTIRIKATVSVTPKNVTAKHTFDLEFFDKDGASIGTATEKFTTTTDTGQFVSNFVHNAKVGKKVVEGVKCTYSISTTNPAGGSDSKEARIGTAGTPSLNDPGAGAFVVKVNVLNVDLVGKNAKYSFDASASGGTSPYAGQILLEFSFYNEDKVKIGPTQVAFYLETQSGGTFTGKDTFLAPPNTAGITLKMTIVVTDAASKQGGASDSSSTGTVP